MSTISAREADMMRKRRQLNPDGTAVPDAPAAAVPQPQTVQSIVDAHMGQPAVNRVALNASSSVARPAGSAIAPQRTEQSASDAPRPVDTMAAYRARVANNNAAMFAQQDFANLARSGASSDQLAVAHQNLDDYRAANTDPAAQARINDRLGATRTVAEGPVREGAQGVNTRMAAAKYQQGISESNTRLITPEEASIKSGFDVTTGQNQSTGRLIPAREAAAKAKAELGTATDTQAQKEVVPGSEARQAQMRLTTARENAATGNVDVHAAADAADARLKAATDAHQQAVLAAQTGNPEAMAKLQRSKTELEQATTDRDIAIAKAHTAAYVGDGKDGATSIVGEQIGAARAEAGAKASQQKRQAAIETYGDPTQLVAGSAPHFASMKNRVGSRTAGIGGAVDFGLNTGVVAPHLSGPSIEDDTNQIDSFESRVVNRLIDYAKLDPIGAQGAANDLLNNMPTPQSDETYTAQVGSPQKFQHYAEKLTRIRSTLKRIAGR